MPQPITTILADDHFVFRAGFKNLIATEEDVALLSTATDGRLLLEQLSRQKPNVVLIAVHLPGGIDACLQISKQYPKIGIVVLGPAANEKELIDMMEAGACSIIDKTATMHQIVQCIRDVHTNGTGTSNSFTNKAGLGKTEIMVLQLICREMDSEQIGRELHLSKHTIDRVRKTLLQKCGVKNTAGLVVWAFRNGIVKL